MNKHKAETELRRVHPAKKSLCLAPCTSHPVKHCTLLNMPGGQKATQNNIVIGKKGAIISSDGARWC